MSLFNYHNQGEMKIKHTTYDATHTRRSMVRRASDVSVKIKNYFSRRLSRRSYAGSSRRSATERPTTIWPGYETGTSVPVRRSEMTPYLTQKYQVKEAARREEKTIVSAHHSGNYLPLRSPKHRPADDTYPILRRKTKFFKEKPSTNSLEGPSYTEDGNQNMKKLLNLRQAMREGKMEQVVSPQHISRPERLSAPPQNFLHEFASTASAESSRGRTSSRHGPPLSYARHASPGRKSRSVSRVRDYIRASVDVLDERRKEVQSKFKAPLDHLHYPSFISRRTSVDSDESFFCKGENNEGQNANDQATLSSRHYDPTRDRTSSGAKTSPCYAPDYCKICKTYAMVGIQGLCEKCEVDSDYEDDIRPTPPLKDAKTLAMSKQPQTQHYFQVETNVRSLENVTDLATRPIFNPVPREAEQMKTQRRLEQWSAKYEGCNDAYAEERDTTPLVPRKNKIHSKVVSRDTHFYDFYDDVLGNH